MTSFFPILADAPANAAPAGSPLQPIIMMVLIMVIFWVLIIRPQQKQRKELAAKVAAMKVGDKVISAGGIHGKVHRLRDTSVLVKVNENNIMEFEKTSIQTVISKKAAAKAAKEIEATEADSAE